MSNDQQNNQDNQAKSETITQYLGLDLKDVSDQIKDEYKVAERFVRSKREAWRKYLKLYINQRKNPKKVGDTLMFSTHQTILASLYKDRHPLDGDRLTWVGRFFYGFMIGYGTWKRRVLPRNCRIATQ